MWSRRDTKLGRQVRGVQKKTCKPATQVMAPLPGIRLQMSMRVFAQTTIDYGVPFTTIGGGVGLYVSNQLGFKIRNDLTKNLQDIIETVFIEILTNVGKNIIISVIYKPSNNRFNEFKDIIDEILENIDKQNKLCYLIGDFNIDLFK